MTQLLLDPKADRSIDQHFPADFVIKLNHSAFLLKL